MTALVVLGHFRGVAALAAGRGRLAQHERPLVLDGTRVIRIDLMAVPATDFGRRHRAAAVLLDNPRTALPMADDTVVGAHRQRVGRFFVPGRGPSGPDGQHDKPQPDDRDNDDHAPNKEPRPPRALLGSWFFHGLPRAGIFSPRRRIGERGLAYL